MYTTITLKEARRETANNKKKQREWRHAHKKELQATWNKNKKLNRARAQRYYLKNKEALNKYNRKYRLENKQKLKKSRNKPETKAHTKKTHRKYRKLHPEQKAARQHRRRGKGFILIAPKRFFKCPVDFHHLAPDSPFVVPIPRNIHKFFCGDRHFVVLAAFMPALFGLNLINEVKE